MDVVVVMVVVASLVVGIVGTDIVVTLFMGLEDKVVVAAVISMGTVAIAFVTSDLVDLLATIALNFSVDTVARSYP